GTLGDVSPRRYRSIGNCTETPYFCFSWTCRRLRSFPQSCLSICAPFMHSESLLCPPNAHDVQPGPFGLVRQMAVPRGGGKLRDMKFHAVPLKLRTSTSESFSSVSTTIATSESG